MYRPFIKTPWLVRKIFSSYVWRMPAGKKTVYLTFDDGPHPQVTPFVLDALKKYGAFATFFCLGKNVLLYPDVYRRILQEGHSVGNHTHNHLNGWKVSVAHYLQNVAEAARHISSKLFRPPYGKIKIRQARAIRKLLGPGAKIVMWEVLSADFDTQLEPDACLRYVLEHYSDGSIIVFHDSEKAFPRLREVLPKVLEHLHAEGYACQKLDS